MEFRIKLNMRQEINLPIDLPSKHFNAFSFRAKSDVCVRCHFVYRTAEGRVGQEVIFLENREERFRSRMNSLSEGEVVESFLSLLVFNLENAKGNLDLCDFSFFSREQIPEEIRLTDGSISCGFLRKNGPVLQYLSTTDFRLREEGDKILFSEGTPIGENVNLLNRRLPLGRMVQQSFYGTCRPPYQPGFLHGRVWRYNPVQSGDNFGNVSEIVDMEWRADSLRFKIRPLDYAKTAVPADAYLEVTYRFYKNCLQVENRFVDFSMFPNPELRAQELPCFYPIAPLNRFVWPLSDGRLQFENNLGFWDRMPYKARQHFKVGEPWSAWVNDDGYGVGLCTPDISDHFAGRYVEEEMTHPACLASSVNYTAAVRYFELECLRPIRNTYYLTVGHVEEIAKRFRSIFKKSSKRR